MTCKDCIHYNACSSWCSTLERDESYKYCNNFKSTNDYAEVKHGYWMSYPSDAYMKCSVCGIEYLKLQMPKIVGYCPNPNCGTKMNGERSVE